MRQIIRMTIGLTLAVAGVLSAEAGEWERNGDIATEWRLFPQRALFPGQANVRLSPSLRLETELVYGWASGSDFLTIHPFFRLDAHDSHRTHLDLRALNWLHLGNRWTLMVGIGKVFWGVTESRHLVDIINQTDMVEDIDGEDKLGQPMINLTLERDWGVLDLFYLPFFRKRRFPAADARFRGPLDIQGNAAYESGTKTFHPDWAIRWSNTLQAFDIGVSHFNGTSREPRFLPEAGLTGPYLRAYYDIINQTSIDLQWTSNAWLWKLEAMTRGGHGDRFAAAVAGFEYTLFQVFPNAADLGLLAEVLYDGRGTDAPPVLYNNDVFLGARWAFNDVSNTSLLGGPIIDYKTGEVLVFLEIERRISNTLLCVIDIRKFLNSDTKSPMYGIRRDDVVSVKISRFF